MLTIQTVKYTVYNLTIAQISMTWLLEEEKKYKMKILRNLFKASLYLGYKASNKANQNLSMQTLVKGTLTSLLLKKFYNEAAFCYNNR